MEQLKQQVCAIPLEIGSKQQLQEGNNNYNEYTIIENGKKSLNNTQSADSLPPAHRFTPSELYDLRRVIRYYCCMTISSKE